MRGILPLRGLAILPLLAAMSAACSSSHGATADRDTRATSSRTPDPAATYTPVTSADDVQALLASLVARVKDVAAGDVSGARGRVDHCRILSGLADDLDGRKPNVLVNAEAGRLIRSAEEICPADGAGASRLLEKARTA